MLTKQEIIHKLTLCFDSKKAEGAKKYYPTKMTVLGVKVPDLKNILKEYKLELKQISEKEKIKLIKELVNTNIFECQQFGFEILNNDQQLLNFITKNDVLAMKKNMDNWLSVDYFAGVLLGPLWRENKISYETIKKLAKSKDFWERRIAVVATVALNQKARGGRGDAEQTIKICSLVINDKNDMVIKALSWALRELAKRDKQSVIDFIDKNNTFLSQKIKREVGNKLNFGKKIVKS